MFGWILRPIRAAAAALFDPPCPFGDWPASRCAGCAQDRHWVLSERAMHAPDTSGAA